ncbi:cellulase family glycosylhydrolase [Flammeovirga agarivorans]|uniref:Cellulase family glycosylhydrolase n=1 Tax=Flammeovirga agarivorans TaxID=2726742 RepID=A0A7X8SIG5_9BACT|nr:cellulase family glycosylhydrolase [Flammeovirga agarivorans]NLR90801.1 cellulase family glycosylhydrolase [Flammeovirga agarivorans]
MNTSKLSFFSGCLLILSLIFTPFFLKAQVSSNGLLQVNGNKVVNRNGQSVSFAGPSLFWSNNNWGGEKFYNEGVVSWVKQDWNAGIIRAAMGVEDGGGYFDDPGSNKARVETIVNAAVANDMYVIIDWHSHYANEHDWAAAYGFFEEMAQKYGHLDNVLYEVFNEPKYTSWSQGIKPYAESIISAIRKHDPDNIIIVGTPKWSQDVDDAANDPINQPNIAYTLHFYAGSHGQFLRDKGNYALSRGLALFVTEWGSVNADGDGGVNYDETWAWVDWMKNNGISHCNWSINDKSEGASALYPGASTTGGWSNLTASGAFAKEIMQSYSSNGEGSNGNGEVETQNCSVVTLPGILEAENYCRMQGVQKENSSEGGENIGYVDDGDWLEYTINVPSPGTYTVDVRVASDGGGNQFRFDQNEGNDILATYNVNATGGWQNWTTISQEVTFSTAGEQALGLYAIVGGFNVNWIEFKSSSSCQSNGLQNLSISPSSTSVKVGNQVQLSASGTDNCGDAISVNPTWSSNAPNGTFYASTVGSYTVTASQNGITATANITVTNEDIPPTGNGVVSQYGRLQVAGNKVAAANGQSVALGGNSFFWSNNGWGGEKFYNASVVSSLKNDFNSKIVRAAMGVEDPGGYIDDKAGNKAKVETVVDAAIANDMYVIIDWHSHHAENNTNEAVQFFTEMAQKYGNNDHVIYEIYNEPLQVSWSGTIKPYAQQVVNAIRSIDPDNLIIVGTPTWSQDVDQAANDPIQDNNIAYTLHFYAGTHGQYLRDKGNYAMSQGIALVVTEWGTVNANGDGGVAYDETWAWVDWMEANGISHCNWSVNDKAEGASMLNPGASTTGGWSDSDLTTSGLLLKEILGTTTPPPCTTCPPPSGETIRLEAENFTFMGGVQTENCSEGGQNVGWIDAGDWLAFHNVNIPTSGNYTISYRVASPQNGGKVQLEGNEGQSVYGSVDVPNTGGWQNWQTVSHSAYLNAGSQNFGIGFPSGAFNLNWIEISSSSNGRQISSSTESLEAELVAYPNPTSSRLTLANISNKFTQLEVFTVEGKLKGMYRLDNQGSFTLDVGHLQKGVYFIRLQGDNTSKSVRFIKQ